MEVNTGGRGEMKGEREREKEEMQKSLNGGSGREGGGMSSNVVRREGRGGGRVCVCVIDLSMGGWMDGALKCHT